jgi:hypothetical protein
MAVSPPSNEAEGDGAAGHRVGPTVTKHSPGRPVPVRCGVATPLGTPLRVSGNAEGGGGKSPLTVAEAVRRPSAPLGWSKRERWHPCQFGQAQPVLGALWEAGEVAVGVKVAQIPRRPRAPDRPRPTRDVASPALPVGGRRVCPWVEPAVVELPVLGLALGLLSALQQQGQDVEEPGDDERGSP